MTSGLRDKIEDMIPGEVVVVGCAIAVAVIGVSALLWSLWNLYTDPKVE